MPLNELVLDFEGKSAEEVRLTDRPVAVGDTVQIDNQDWTVVRELRRTQRDNPRFLLKRAGGGSAERSSSPPRFA